MLNTEDKRTPMDAQRRFRLAAAHFALWGGRVVLLALSVASISAQSFAWLESPKRGRRMLLDLDNRSFRRSLKPDQFQQTPAMPEWFPPPGAVALANERDPHLIPQGEIQAAYMTRMTVPQTRSFYDKVLYERRCSQSFWQLETTPGTKRLNTRGSHFKFCSTPQAEVRVSFRPESDGTRVYLTYKTRVRQPTGALSIVAYDEDTSTVVVEEAQTGARYRANAFLFDVCGRNYGGPHAPECRMTPTGRKR
jgi:hypothetical protein